MSWIHIVWFTKDLKHLDFDFRTTSLHPLCGFSAEEMQQNGVNMNDLQIRLLQKIEELTLYIIDLEERISELENNK